MQLCWSFMLNLKNKSLRIRKHQVFFSKKFVFHERSFGHKKNFWQLYRKIFDENMKKSRRQTEEDLEKTPFLMKMSFMKTLLWKSNCRSENSSRNLRVKSLNMVCSKFKIKTKTFLLERHILIQNNSLETKNSILTKVLKVLKIGTEGPERSALQSKKC